MSRDETVFMASRNRAFLDRTGCFSTLLFLIIILCCSVFLIWAYVAELDEVTHGSGVVVPSRQVQLIQNLEGGILQEMHVKEGETVKKGQVLISIDNTQFRASLQEAKAQQDIVHADILRLRAEIEAKDLVFNREFVKRRSLLVKDSLRFFRSRKKAHLSTVKSLEESQWKLQKELWDNLSAYTRLNAERSGLAKLEFTKVLKNSAPEITRKELLHFESRKKALAEQLGFIDKSLKLSLSEYEVTKGLVKDKVLPDIEQIRIEIQINELRSQRGKVERDFRQSAAEEARKRQTEVFRLERKISEKQSAIDDFVNGIRLKAIEELKLREEEQSSLKEQIVNLEDKVNRTVVRSPVYGVVNQVLINTVGGVIKPGMDLIELVPLDDTLLIETRIKPQDIAFLRHHQKALVKVSAFDFSIYGGLDGKIETISSDTHEDEFKNQYYKVMVRTEKNYLSSTKGELHIIPGMMTTTDVIIGKKTVLDYLLKPFNKAKEKALREK